MTLDYILWFDFDMYITVIAKYDTVGFSYDSIKML